MENFSTIREMAGRNWQHWQETVQMAVNGNNGVDSLQEIGDVVYFWV